MLDELREITEDEESSDGRRLTALLDGWSGEKQGKEGLTAYRLAERGGVSDICCFFGGLSRSRKKRDGRRRFEACCVSDAPQG